MTALLMIFRRFPTTFQRFTKIFQNCSEGQTNIPEHFPRISEKFQRLPKTFEEDPKMFWWYTNEFKYNLRDKLDITEIIDIFTCEDIISSHVRILYRFYQFVTTCYTTDFYVINFIFRFFVCVSLGLQKDSSSKKCWKTKEKGRTGKNVTPFILTDFLCYCLTLLKLCP